jgi:hypothetical protein
MKTIGASKPFNSQLANAHGNEETLFARAVLCEVDGPFRLREKRCEPSFCVLWQYPVFAVDEDLDPAALKQPRRSKKSTPTPEQMLALFKIDVENPRTTLITAVELRAQFDAHGWDRIAAPAIRDRLEAEGKLKVHRGAHNSKLTGLPAMVDAFEKQLPRTSKPARKKRRKKMKRKG